MDIIEDFNFYDCGMIAFINGQKNLHETEQSLFKQLASRNYNNLIILDDLFNKPNRIKVLKIMEVETIVLGTTGTYHEKIGKVFQAFKKLNYLPKNAIFTMGEGYFHEYEGLVNFYKIMPMSYSDSQIIIYK